MATNIATDLTLRDIAKRLDPDGNPAKIAEIIAQKNEFFEDVPMVEANGDTYHRSTIRTGLPSGTFRSANEGVENEKSTTSQVDDVLAELSTYSEIDVSVAKMGGNISGNLSAENRSFQQGLGETMVSTAFYGDNDANFKEFHGLGPRYADTGAGNSDNIILGGGAGSDNASIYLIGWSPDTVFMTYPKGSNAGLQMNFNGIRTVLDGNNRQFEAYQTYYQWNLGMTVKDWNYVVRIANIDVSDLAADKSGNSADLTDLCAQAIERLPSQAGIMPRFYMNRKLSGFLRRQRNNTTNVQFGTEEVFGRTVTTIDDIPVKRLDALTSTEATVS